MTHSDAVPPRNPRRLGLYLPWGLALALVFGWSIWWLWLSHQTAQRLDAAAANLRAQGGQAVWTTRKIGGYPFRLDVDLTGVQLADASGWAIALPTLHAEAYAFEPDHWIIGTADGAAITQPGGTLLTLTSPRMRASLNSWDQHPPKLSFVAENVSFAAGPPASPFPLASAKLLQLYTRAGPDDQGAILLMATGGTATLGSGLAALAGGQPVGLKLDAIFSHASALGGAHGWHASVTDWSRRGGAFTVQHLDFTAGATSLSATNGQFGADANGDLAGDVPAQLHTPAGAAATVLSSRQGVLWLGPATPGRGQPAPARLSAAPRAF